MKRRIISMFLSISMVAVMVGCGTKEDNKSDSDVAEVAEGNEEEKKDSDTGNDDEKVTIVYQCWNPYPEIFESVKQDFEAKHPNIVVEYVMAPYTEHIQKLKIDLVSGQGPDVYGLQTGAAMQEFRDFELDLAPLATEKWGDNWKERFVPFAVELLDEGGMFYGMPLGTGYAGMLWADLSYFEKYNLEVPKNLNELKEVTKKLRENGEKYPFAIGAKDDWINLDMWMNIANDINTEKLYAAIDGEIPFTDPELVESLTIWQSLFTDQVFQDGALGVNMYVDTTDLFERDGIVPMVTNGAWLINSYLNPDETMSDIFNGGEHPHTTFIMGWNNDGTPASVQANVEIAMCINKDSKQQEAAWEFVSYMMDEGQDILVNEYLQYFPSRADLEYSGSLSEEGIENLNILMDWGTNNVAGYRENPYPELKEAITSNLKSLALGDITPEDAELQSKKYQK